jgi:hypothetical protein
MQICNPNVCYIFAGNDHPVEILSGRHDTINSEYPVE